MLDHSDGDVLRPQLFRPPRLLVQLPPWYRVFFSNLADVLLLRRPGLPAMTAQPARFWPDVFVSRGLPLRSLARSALYHVFAIVVVWGYAVTFPMRPPPRVRNPFANSTITYYSVDEYLPPLESPSQQLKEERKGEPAYARQRIISLPKNPDNFRQTIISPPQVKINQDVPLPNMVVWTPVPSVPQAATQRSPAQLKLPAVPISVIAPPPETRRDLAQLRGPALDPQVVEPPPSAREARLKLPKVPAPAAVEPPAAALDARLNAPALPTPGAVGPPPSPLDARLQRPNIPAPSVIEPPAAVDNTKRRVGDINISHLETRVAAPKLPVGEQRAAGAGAQTGQPGAGPSPMPAPPSTQGTAASQAAGQFIALSLKPVPVTGPITIPAGNRAGEFMAAPEGKPGAPGTPDIRGGGKNAGTNGTAGTAPEGISISGGKAAPGAVAVVAKPVEPPPSPAPTLTPSARDTLLAAVRPVRVSDVARRTQPSTAAAGPAKIADEVFGPRKYYTMVLNAPNLTSAVGTWIVRFAELHQDHTAGDVTAPVATLKVDPAYPTDLVQAGVEGTVTLYAVIHSDGTVGEVRVLKGVDQRLDENARLALSRWRFRPATKNGAAIALEAVVQIPFRATRFKE